MGEIFLKGMTFYGRHGVLEEEKVLGQKFIVDARLDVDIERACETDDVLDTVSYAQVFERVRGICEAERFNLIEALAGRIAKAILEDFHNVDGVEISVKKPQAPISGMFDYMQVTVRRSRNG